MLSLSETFAVSNERMDLSQVDSLECILKTIQFKTVNMDNAFINQDAAAALFGMFLITEL